MESVDRCLTDECFCGVRFSNLGRMYSGLMTTNVHALSTIRSHISEIVHCCIFIQNITTIIIYTIHLAN